MVQQTVQSIDGCFVQYGCGWSAPAGWRNFDASPTLRFERLPLIGRLYSRNGRRFPSNVDYGDIVRGLPLTPGSVDLLYASHVLEHLAYEDMLLALRHSYGLLKPGGVFRLIVPDLAVRARHYLKAHEAGDPQAASRFMASCHLGERRRPRGMTMLTRLLGNSAHLWMWDEAGMTAALANAGFHSIRRCVMGDSGFPAFAQVEEHGRFHDGPSEPELAMQALK